MKSYDAHFRLRVFEEILQPQLAEIDESIHEIMLLAANICSTYLKTTLLNRG